MFGVELVSHTSDEVIVSEKSNTELLLLFWGGYSARKLDSLLEC